MQTQVAILTPDSERWEEFTARLSGPDGVNMHEDDAGNLKCECDGKTLTHSAAILLAYFPEFDVNATLDYFRDRGGYCDCEVLWNVDKD